jgi:N,N'-diacetyllegionaminate synthase
MPTDIMLGKLRVSEQVPPVFLPDIDVYFKGNVSIALSLLEKLKSAGASVVKGALIHDLDICFDGSVEAAYYKPGTGIVKERYRDVLHRHLLPLKDAEVIYRRANDLELEIVLTVYDFEGADFAAAMGAGALKVASSNITHAPLIRYLARRDIPLIIDTGRSTLEEIARAVTWAREAGAEKLIVQHSPAAPPAPLEQQHLRMMPTLGRVFDCPVGLSDHHAGDEMMLAAVALGAVVIEKGVCADDVEGDIDLAHAARISDIPAIIEKINKVWRGLGASMRSLPSDRSKPVDRMGLVAARDILVGDRLTVDNVRFALAVPQETILVENWDFVSGCGWAVSKCLLAGQPISWGHVCQLTTSSQTV